MEMELQADIKAPFRTQPRVAQAGSALVVAGVLLLMVVMPLHLIGFIAFASAEGASALWRKLLLMAFLSTILAFGVWMSQALIRLGYEAARPKAALLAIAVGALALQAVAALVGCSMSLLLVEIFGIPLCIVGGFIVYSAGMEFSGIANCKSVGRGLGALAGLAWGYFYTEGQLAAAGCMLVGGLAAEGLGRAIRRAMRHLQRRAEAIQNGANAGNQTHAA